MQGNPNPPLEVQLETLKATPPAQIRMGDVKKLLSACGKLVSDNQAALLVQFIKERPECDMLVFEILGECALSDRPNDRLAVLARRLKPHAQAWLPTSPPSAEIDAAKAWFCSVAEKENLLETPNLLRGITLWLLEVHRNPELFLRAFLIFGNAVSASKGSHKAGASRGAMRENSGFIMRSMARTVFAMGKGAKPKFLKLHEMVGPIETVLTHLNERSQAAEQALAEKADLRTRITTLERTTSEQASGIQNLESERQKLLEQVAVLQKQVDEYKAKHDQAVGHTESASAEAKKTVTAKLQEKLLPKLKDARLYADRPNPAVQQVLRLLGEMEQELQQKQPI